MEEQLDVILPRGRNLRKNKNRLTGLQKEEEEEGI